MPAPVASESFQTHEGLDSSLAPELTRAFEPHLILATRRFHRATAGGFVVFLGRAVVQALAVALQIGQLLLHLFAHTLPHSLAQLLQLGDDFATVIGFELLQ